jgi:hypothetical protein
MLKQKVNSKKITIRLTMFWLRNCQCPSPLIDYWMGITWFLPSHRLAWIFKVPKKEKHILSAGRLHLCSPCSPLYFSSLTFNKLHLHPHVLQWILPAGHKELLLPLTAQSFYYLKSQHLWVRARKYTPIFGSQFVNGIISSVFLQKNCYSKSFGERFII